MGVVKHPDFPSYGLERESCPTCEKIPATLGQQEKLLQRMSGRHQGLLIKKFKQNVKK